MQGDGQGEGLHAGQEEGESRIIKCSPDTERESAAMETISTRKGVSNHAQVQSNVGKKRAKTTLQARKCAGQLASLGSVNSRNSCVALKLDNSYDFKKNWIQINLVLSSVWSGFPVPLRTIIFILRLSQVRVIQRRQGPHDFGCKYPHHSASLYTPICPGSALLSL